MSQIGSNISLLQTLAAQKSFKSSAATANPFAATGPAFGSQAANPFGEVKGNLLCPAHTGGAMGIGDNLCISA